MNFFSVTCDAVQYTGKTGRILSQHNVQDVTQFLVGIRLL